MEDNENMREPDNQITLILNSAKYKDKKTLAYAKGEGLKVRELEYMKTSLTETQIIDLARQIGVKVEELVNKEEPVYTENYNGSDFDDDGWAKALKEHPEMLRSPIARKGDKAIIVSTPTDVLQL